MAVLQQSKYFRIHYMAPLGHPPTRLCLVLVAGDGAVGAVPLRSFTKNSPSSNLVLPLAKAEAISTSPNKHI